MDTICGIRKKCGCTAAVVFCYIVMQIFLFAFCEGPSASPLQDTGSIYIMEAMTALSHAAVTQRNTDYGSLAQLSECVQAPRQLCDAFTEKSELDAFCAERFALWSIFIDGIKESQSSSNMVARK